MRLLLGTPALVLLAAPALGPSLFAPKEGSSVRKTFTEETSWDMESIVQRMDGEEVEMPPLDAEMQVERRLVVRDTYRAVGDGRPKTLARTVEHCGVTSELIVNAMGQEEGSSLSYVSELTAASVVFEWDPDDEAFTCRPEEDEEVEPTLLEGLREDLDLRGLLPGEGVEEGDTWTVEGDALRDLVSPGGAWSLQLDEAEGKGTIVPLEDGALAAGVFLAMATDDVEGELELTHGGRLEMDGRELVVLGLELEAEFEGDSGELYQMVLDRLGLARRVQAVNSTWVVEGSGSLTWDVAAGHFLTLELNLGTEIEMEVEFEDSGSTLVIEGTLAGETKLRAECAAVE